MSGFYLEVPGVALPVRPNSHAEFWTEPDAIRIAWGGTCRLLQEPPGLAWRSGPAFGNPQGHTRSWPNRIPSNGTRGFTNVRLTRLPPEVASATSPCSSEISAKMSNVALRMAVSLMAAGPAQKVVALMPEFTDRSASEANLISTVNAGKSFESVCKTKPRTLRAGPRGTFSAGNFAAQDFWLGNPAEWQTRGY